MKKQLTEDRLNAIIRESIEEVMAGNNAPAGNNNFNRIVNLNKQLWAIKKEADALGLENASKWIYMAIQSIDREYLRDSVTGGFNKAKDTVKGWINKK